MPSPYRTAGSTSPSTHEASASAVVALASYVVATTWALHLGLVGVPSLMGSSLLKEPLVPTRAAALLHAGVALLAHVVGRPLWSARNDGGNDGANDGGNDDDDDAGAASAPRSTHATRAPNALSATAWALVSLTNGTALWTALAVCFGVSALYKLTETAHLGLLLASLTAVPGAALYGCAPGAQWEWHRVLVLGDGAFHPIDFVWFGGAWGEDPSLHTHSQPPPKKIETKKQS